MIGRRRGEADLNRDMWTQANAEYTQAHAARAQAAEEISWGIFNIPECQVGVLGDVAGLDVLVSWPAGSRRWLGGSLPRR
jgi:hypothetical protein